MDYKQLVYEIRAYRVKTDLATFQPAICEIAACAIETLLAERDAFVKHGRWIDKGREGDFSWNIDGRGRSWSITECSVCGQRLCGIPQTKYCPNCGAKMDLPAVSEQSES